MIPVRAETVADREGIRQVNTLAFERDNEARLVDAIRQSSAFVPALSLVATDGAQIVGHILFSEISIRTASHPAPALALAPLAVRPGFQNQGIGSALVRHGLAECTRLGHGIVIVIGHASYYPRFGFSPARARGLEAPFPVADKAFMVQELRAEALHGVRGMVEYPPPFNLV